MARYGKAADIKVGVVGYGKAFGMGQYHLTHLRQYGATPTAVAEPVAERRHIAEQEFPGIATYASVAEMLRKSAVNLAVIITPHNSHARLALQCLKGGCHVVCEKPLAITTAECDRMMAEARKHKVMLSTYHNRHWDGCILRAVKLIKDKKAIGDVYRVECRMGSFGQPGDWWRSSKSISGGILYDWGVHLLEYALQLIDTEISEVSAFAVNGIWADKTPWKKDANEDEATAVVRFRNGAMLTLTISQLDTNPKPGMLEIKGTRGTYIMDHTTYTLIQPRGKRTVTTKSPNVPDRHNLYYRNVIEHLVKGVPLVITPEWARRPIHILDLADRSAKSGRTLKAKYG